MASVEFIAKGLTFVRVALAKSLSDGDDVNAAGLAAARWGSSSAPARILRAVGAGTYADQGDFGAAATEFFTVVEQLSVLGRLTGIRRVPLQTRVLTATSGVSAHWVGEGNPKPVSKMAFTSGSLAPLKIASLAIITQELATSSDPAAEGVIRRDMLRAMSEVIDEALLDPSNAGDAGVSPASITYGVSPISAGTDPTADLRLLIEAFSGNLESASFLMTPSVAASLAGSARPGIGIRGGELLGAPAIASRSAPANTIILVDTSALALGEGAAEIRVSRNATIEMLDADLVQNATTGTGTSLISLWQANCLGVLSEKQMNWEIQRAGAVAMIADVNYAPVVS